MAPHSREVLSSIPTWGGPSSVCGKFACSTELSILMVAIAL